jgi:predicted metalloendopeptidase
VRRARLLLAAAAACGAPAFAGIDLAAIDRGVDPCADFYAFANKRWLDASRIPADRSRWGSFDAVGLAAEQALARAMEKAAAAPQPEGSSRRKVIDFYASGMDEAAIARAGIGPLAPLLAAAAGIEGPGSLARVLASLHVRGIRPGFAFEVSPDPKESGRYLAAITQDSFRGGHTLGLPDRDYYFLDDERSKALREAYVAHVARVLGLAGDAEAAAHATRVMALETELARSMMTAVERRDVDRTYNRMDPGELERAAPGFPWRAYFAAIGAQDLTVLNVRQPAYMKRFAELAATRPAADWRAYVRWQLLRAASDKVDARFEAAHFDFYEKTLLGTQQPATRSKRVALIIGGRYGEQPMAEGLGRIYVDEAFPPEAKARMLAMVDNVKAALRERLRAVEWMTEETRAVSLQKLDAMGVKMGYPDRWKDFSSARVGSGPFVENWMAANRFAHERGVARIGKAVDRREWSSSPHIVNAFYSQANNEIVFPAAILQPPFFDLAADDAANYGAIGMVIGHEITHGFDDRGRRFDKDGNLREWWSAEDARRYRERARKIEAQYGAYAGVDGIKVNGALTLGENISDIGGARIAYLALARANAARPAGALDGFTAEQRFFLSFANIWRSLQRAEQERVRLRTDSHSPPRLRVKGVVVNMPEFARAFACDEATALLPAAQRGEIW